MKASQPTRAERFLRRYRVLEGLLEKRYGDASKGSVVYEYIRSDDAASYRYELNLIREIRNLLTHNALESGQPVVEPSDSVLRALEMVIEHVEKPRMAIDCGTPEHQILCAHRSDRIAEIMHCMRKNGFSNVPVMERDQIVGVFSVASIFQFLEENGLEALEANARIADLGNAIDIAQLGYERYRFMPETTTVMEVRAAFQGYYRRNDRLRAVFITPTGNACERLLALLTPWDVMKVDSFDKGDIQE